MAVDIKEINADNCVVVSSDSRKIGFLGKLRQCFLAGPHLQPPDNFFIRSKIRHYAEQGLPYDDMWLVIKLRDTKVVDNSRIMMLNNMLSYDQKRYLCHLAHHLVNYAERPDPVQYYPIFAMHGGGRVIHNDFDDVLSFFLGNNIPWKLRKFVRPFKIKFFDLNETAIRLKIYRCVKKGCYFDAIEEWFKLRGTPLNKSQIRILNNPAVLSYDQARRLALLADHLANFAEGHVIDTTLLNYPGGNRVVKDDFDDMLGFFLAVSTHRMLVDLDSVLMFKIKHHFSNFVWRSRDFRSPLDLKE